MPEKYSANLHFKNTNLTGLGLGLGLTLQDRGVSSSVHRKYHLERL